MAGRMGREERFQFAKSAASQSERVGFYWLGWCYQFGTGCEGDLEKARELYFIAAQLGFVCSMRSLGALLDESDRQRWLWWGRAAVLGDALWYLCSFSDVVEKFNSVSANCAVVFHIGQTLNEHVSVEKRTIFGNRYDFNNLNGPANSAISFYKSQLSSCRRAVDMWSHVSIRCGVVKDIRVLIGKLVWESRDLALFKV
jgi:hypothetical protein